MLIAALTVAAALPSLASALPPDFDELRRAATKPGGSEERPRLARPLKQPAGSGVLDRPPLERRIDPGAGSLALRARGPVIGARERLLDRLGPAGVVEIDAATGTPRMVARLGSALTGPSDRDPAEIALRYVGGHRTLFALGREGLSELELVDRYTTGTGITTMHWHASYAGLELVGDELAANVDSEGRLLNVLGSVPADPSVPSTEPELSATEALQIAAGDAGAETPGDVTAGPDGADSETSFAGGHLARLVLYDMQGGPRLSWRVELSADSQHYYVYNVDALDGRLLSRYNLVANESARTHDLWPLAGEFGTFGGGNATLRPLLRLGNGMDDPWRYNTQAPPYNLPFQTLGGNQAFLLLDFNDDDGASANEAFFVHPSDGANNWDFPQQYFNNAPPLRCPPNGRCTWNPAGPFQNWYTNAFQNGTQAYWFVNQFHDHLEQAPIGFTEASGNFELVNQDGAGGLANDDLFLQALDGANTGVGYPDEKHVNNANMLTLEDGVSPKMQMYLFTQFVPGAPPGDPAFEVNGADDAQIVYHEYTHGLSNRLVGGPSTQGSLAAQQSGAMGEGWSDFYAQDYLVAKGLLPDNPNRSGELIQGRYENFFSIRTQAVDCAIGAPKGQCPAEKSGRAGPGGYTYADYGKVRAGGPEVHDDGEIWVQTLWDLRRALIAKYGLQTGLARVRQLVTDGLRLTPIKPSFLDARNGILQAGAGADFNAKKTIWKVFAKRGMGSNARSDGANDKKPKAGFKNPTKKGKGKKGKG